MSTPVSDVVPGRGPAVVVTGLLLGVSETWVKGSRFLRVHLTDFTKPKIGWKSKKLANANEFLAAETPETDDSYATLDPEATFDLSVFPADFPALEAAFKAVTGKQLEVSSYTKNFEQALGAEFADEDSNEFYDAYGNAKRQSGVHVLHAKRQKLPEAEVVYTEVHRLPLKYWLTLKVFQKEFRGDWELKPKFTSSGAPMYKVYVDGKVPSSVLNADPQFKRAYRKLIELKTPPIPTETEIESIGSIQSYQPLVAPRRVNGAHESLHGVHNDLDEIDEESDEIDDPSSTESYNQRGWDVARKRRERERERAAEDQPKRPLRQQPTQNSCHPNGGVPFPAFSALSELRGIRVQTRSFYVNVLVTKIKTPPAQRFFWRSGRQLTFSGLTLRIKDAENAALDLEVGPDDLTRFLELNVDDLPYSVVDRAIKRSVSKLVDQTPKRMLIRHSEMPMLGTDTRLPVWQWVFTDAII